jgi:hypothetical protein
MSKNAPETIWAFPPSGFDEPDIWWATPHEDAIEYRLEDLPPTLAAALELPEVKALVEALERIAKEEPGSPYEDTICQGLAQDALNALAQIKEPK